MNQPQDLDFFDLRTLIRVVWRARYIVAGCALGMAIAAYSVTYLMTPYYRVTTVVADASDPSGSAGLMSALGQLGSLASLAGVGGLAGEVRASDEALAVLTSDDFLDRFMTAHGLIPVLYAKQWDAEKKAWDPEKGRPPTHGSAVRYFRGLITTSRDRRTSLITVSVDWKDRVLAARWCHGLIQDLNAEMQNRALSRAREHIKYLRQQIDVEGSVETRQAVGRLLEAQLKQEMLASVSRDYVFKVVSPGRAPDPDRFVRPRRMLLAAIGFLFGSGLGVLLAFIRINRVSKTA